jgi:hypothetical protein
VSVRRAATVASLLLLSGCTVRGPAGAVLPPVGGSDLASALIWSVVASIAGFGLCVAAAVWLPVKRTAIAGAAGFLATLFLALSVKVIQPYLGWIVLGLFISGLGAALYAIRRYHLFAHMAVAFGSDMANAETEVDAERVKDSHAAMQRIAGVKPLIDKALAVVKAVKA